MANKPGLLARLMPSRARNPVVTTLYTHAIGQPLMVHPVLGEALLGAYLSGAVHAPEPLIEGAVAAAPDGAAAAPEAGGEVRVLNISGALINRPAPGLCDPGPVSYEAIGDALDEAVADANVKAIVMRFNSPGGMAAGCFDLSDRIYAARGTKPIYAMVDDYAYSAAFANASACDEIWVTRTAGVGSVGVVCWHVDQSEYDKKMGVKVTPIFAGARKVDYSPHMPLSQEAFDREQAEVDRLAEMFIESVAKYRGIEAAAVRATEAGTFNGPQAVAAGFADRVGTFRDLLAHINAPAVEEEDPAAAAANDDTPPAELPEVPAGATQPPEEEGKGTGDLTLNLTVDGAEIAREAIAKVTAEMQPQIVRAALAEQVAAANLAPPIVAALIALDPAKLTVEEIPARIEHARKVADLCAAASRSELAAGFVKKHTSIEKVRTDLVAAAVKEDERVEMNTTPPKPEPRTAEPSRSETIYSRRREAAAGTGK